MFTTSNETIILVETYNQSIINMIKRFKQEKGVDFTVITKYEIKYNTQLCKLFITVKLQLFYIN